VQVRDLGPLDAPVREWLLLFMSISEFLPLSVTLVDVTVPEQVPTRVAAVSWGGADTPHPLPAGSRSCL
jgi:hypothetical protein